MVEIGTVLTPVGKKALLCGSGELGKEVAIELQRYGVEVVALDKYANAPAMQVAHRSHVLSMLDGKKLREVIETERPDYIIPEVEAIATDTLVALEKEGYSVTPTATAAYLTMNREGIRRLAAEQLGLPTSPYKFASTREEFEEAVKEIGMPCVVKPIMSSSGHGQSVVRTADDIDKSWHYAQEGGRAGAGRVIGERHVGVFRHEGFAQGADDLLHYRESWQPQVMSEKALQKAQDIARKVTDALGGYGIFGVELFIKGDDVLFSEVSPRPHDTGMVTMISQDMSQFALHARAVLGLPVPGVRFYGPSASRAIVVEGDTDKVVFGNLDEVLSEEGVQMRIFGKPEVVGHRRLGVILASEGRSCIQETESKIIAQINVSLRNCFGRLNNERIKMKRPGN